MNYNEMMTEDLTLLCARKYKELSLEKKELEKAQKALYAKMREENLPEVKSPFGRFISYVRATYQMPEDVVAMKNAVAEAEERAIAEGRATKEEKTFYKFAELKKDEQF